MKKLLIGSILGLLCGLAAWGADRSGLLELFKLKAYDGMFYVKQMRAPNRFRGPIALIAIDDATFENEAFRKPMILWHGFYAKVLQGLVDAGVGAAALDYILPTVLFDDEIPEYSQVWLKTFARARMKKTRIITGYVEFQERLILPHKNYLQIIGRENLGLFNLTTDRDDFIRRQKLWYSGLESGQTNSFSYAAAKALNPGLQVPGDSILIDFIYPVPAFPTFSFSEVAARAGDRAFMEDNFKGKLVFIGSTDSLSQDRHSSPLNYMAKGEKIKTPGVEIHAQAANTMLSGTFFRSTPRSWDLAVLVLIGLITSLTVMYANKRLALPILPVYLFFLAATGLRLFMDYNLAPVVPGAVALLLAHFSAFGYRHFVTEARQERMEESSAETNRMLGLSFQSQGMLDMAFDKFRKVPLTQGMKEILYILAQDYERKRQFFKAATVYEYIAKRDPGFKDVGVMEKRCREIGQRVAGGKGDPVLVGQGEKKPTLGRYEIVSQLGRGAMGVVYQGRDPRINRTCAVKTFRLDPGLDPEQAKMLKEQFFREAESAGRLHHPNIVAVYDAGEEQDLAYIAMEYLEGEDLKAWAAPGRLLPMAKVASLLSDAAEGLEYAHSMGVVHRDIKPANLMLTKSGRIKITDFGVARVAETSRTQTGEIKGTPQYMSPEQMTGARVDGRSDIYSLGAVLYQMLTGSPPFQADSGPALMHAVLNEPTPDPRKINPDIPKPLVQIISNSLRKDREKRYQSASHMASHLRQAAKWLEKKQGAGANGG